ncbi:MAG: DUF2939 domain-containing protein [Sphingomonas sp.]
MANLRTRVAALAAAALIIAAGAAWYLASPGWTLHQMKAAADANDPAALDLYIDYPALREDLKAEIIGEMKAESKRDKSGFGRLGLAIGTAMTGPVIDALVTPAGIRAALIAKRDQAHTKAQAAAALRLPDDPVIVRRGFSEFLVASKQQPTRGLVFKRHGLSWKLSGVALPPNR